MWGSRQYALVGTALVVVIGGLLAFGFRSSGGTGLLLVAAGWAPIALVSIVGGALTVHFHGRAGAGFPTALLTSILLRLFCGLGGLALATQQGQVTPYLTALLVTFFLMQGFEMIWFLRRARLLRADAGAAG